MKSPFDPISGPAALRPPGRLGWPARSGLVAAALVGVLWTAVHAAVDRPALHARIQARALEALRAKLGPVELAEPVEIDWAFRAWLGPLRLPASTPGAEPLLTIDRIRVRASLVAALAGRLEPASVRLYGVRFAPGERGRELDAAMERWRTRRGPSRAAGTPGRSVDPVIHLRGLTIAIPWQGRTVVLGPIDGRLSRRSGPEGELVETEARFTGGGRIESRLRRPSAEDPGWEFRVTASLDAADLPASARAGVAAEAGHLALVATGTAGPGGFRASLRGDLDRLRLSGERLGPEPVGPLAGRGEGELIWTRSTRRLELRRGRIDPLGPLRLEVDGLLSLDAEPSFQLAVHVPPVAYRALVAAIPPALAPPRAAPRPPGAFGGTLRLTGPLTPMVGWTVQAVLDLAPLRAAVRAEPPSPLLAPFRAFPDGEGGRAVELGPANPAFVPIAELPDHVVRAVTTAEDAGFFGHQGFDFAELLEALSAGARAGHLGRGGSTISQQLAKNLYLSRDRTLVRKAREALVTIGLEATLPKARLLELYLNLIEWGPGLHGIGPAARHYFGVDARRLSPRQACFLAAIIPSPNRSHGLVAAGLGDRAYRTRVDDLLQRLNGFQALDDEALARALVEPLHFAFGAPPPPEPSADGAAPAADERDPPDPAEAEPVDEAARSAGDGG
jgi:penicillin-binding protein 1A